MPAGKVEGSKQVKRFSWMSSRLSNGILSKIGSITSIRLKERSNCSRYIKFLNHASLARVMLLFDRPSFVNLIKLSNPSKWMSFIRQWCMFKDCKYFEYFAKARSGMYRKSELKIDIDFTFESVVWLKTVCNVTLKHCNRSSCNPETCTFYRFEKFLKFHFIVFLFVKQRKKKKTWKTF